MPVKKPDLRQDIELLTAELGTVTPTAESLAAKYMGLNNEEDVRKRIARGEFPLETFKFRQSSHAPYFVHIRHLAEYLDEKKQNAAA